MTNFKCTNPDSNLQPICGNYVEVQNTGIVIFTVNDFVLFVSMFHTMKQLYSLFYPKFVYIIGSVYKAVT
jgi:hypothetical protein